MLRTELFNIKNELFKNKFNPEIYEQLLEQQKELKAKIAKNFVIINFYELENNIERGIEDDQHKGK